MTKIQWTDESWNPIGGCEKISPGCANCYALRMAIRLSTTTDYKMIIDGNKWNGKEILRISKLDKPKRWKKPRMIFVCSMSDLFFEKIPFEWIDAVFSVMSENDQHIYQVLTKRPQRVLDFFKWKWEKVLSEVEQDEKYIPWRPKPNIWFGVTTENQEQADKRIPLLLKIPAKNRFISAEPLLEEIKIMNYLVERNRLNWVIVGPETGPGKRPMKRDWINSLFAQCMVTKTPFFDKKDVLGYGKIPQLAQYPEDATRFIEKHIKINFE